MISFKEMKSDRIMEELKTFEMDFKEVVNIIISDSQITVQIVAYDYWGFTRMNRIVINPDKGYYEIVRDPYERSYMPVLTQDVSNLLNKYGFELHLERKEKKHRTHRLELL